MRYHSIKILPLLLGCVLACLFFGCSNSEWSDLTNEEESIAEWDYPIITNQDTVKIDEPWINDNSKFSSSKNITNLPFDDTDYPYAGIPRIVIETENHQAIKSRKTEIPAKLQTWGKKLPESAVMDLTIKGRGNTSWTDMPKKSYKIEFVKKQEMLGMPKDKDWALIANYADKTLMKNYLMYHLSAELNAYYAPRCEFVELYLNNEYQGVYLLTETIKQAKNRIDIPQSDDSYIVEIDGKYKDGEQVIFSKIIENDSIGKPFRIHYPKNAAQYILDSLEKHIQSFEIYLKNLHKKQDNNVTQWIDINEYVKHYWIQEFSKNPDAKFLTSVFFTWEKHAVIKMGPVWDFDLAFGGHSWDKINLVTDYYIRNSYWNIFLFQDSVLNQSVSNFWIQNKNIFFNTLNTVDSIKNSLYKAADNNFKKWNILHSTNYKYHVHAYKNYEEAVSDLKSWIANRFLWLNNQNNTSQKTTH